jgi:hypothetical protein
MSNRGDGVEQLRSRRDQIKAELAGIEDFRPGSLVARYRRCGKQGCHCARAGDTGHGPSWSLTREVGGKTVTHVIPAAAVEQTQRQMAEHRRFRTLVRELVETSEQLCQAMLVAPEMASEERGKKGVSQRSSARSSLPKSKRS